MGAERTVETTQLAPLVWRLARTADGNQRWRIFTFDFLLLVFLVFIFARIELNIIFVVIAIFMFITAYIAISNRTIHD